MTADDDPRTRARRRVLLVLRRTLWFIAIVLALFLVSIALFFATHVTVLLVVGFSALGSVLLSLPAVLLGVILVAAVDSRGVLRLGRAMSCEPHLRSACWVQVRRQVEAMAGRPLTAYERAAFIDIMFGEMEGGDLVLAEVDDDTFSHSLPAMLARALNRVSGAPP